MKLSVPEKLEEFDGNLEQWFHSALDEFESYAYGLTQIKATKKQVAAMFPTYEEIILVCANAGLESSRAWELAARQTPLPRNRYDYFARAYRTKLEESKVEHFDDLPCAAIHHYELADYTYEMGRIHEADGEMKKAAKCYARALRHLHEGADACDAKMNYHNRDVPRRPAFEASLARMNKFLKKR